MYCAHPALCHTHTEATWKLRSTNTEDVRKRCITNVRPHQPTGDYFDYAVTLTDDYSNFARALGDPSLTTSTTHLD